MWHGAGWNFIVYGLLHGAIVGVERWARNRRAQRGLPPLPESGGLWLLRIFVVFQIVAFSRILFRAADLGSAIQYLESMVSSSGALAPLSGLGLTALATAVVLHYVPQKFSDAALENLRRLPAWLQAGGVVTVAYLLLALTSGDAPFVYFQF